MSQGVESGEQYALRVLITAGYDVVGTVVVALLYEHYHWSFLTLLFVGFLVCVVIIAFTHQLNDWTVEMVNTLYEEHFVKKRGPRLDNHPMPLQPPEPEIELRRLLAQPIPPPKPLPPQVEFEATEEEDSII